MSPRSYGQPDGWRTTQAFLIYDAFDIWAVDPDRRAAAQEPHRGRRPG